jgi:DNA-binding CsgD family transcriptional regulator
MTLVIVLDEEGVVHLVEDPKPARQVKEKILAGSWATNFPLPGSPINVTIRGNSLIVAPNDAPTQPVIYAVPAITDREREALEGLAEGLAYKEIASRYKISPRTVRDRIERLKIKLNAVSPIQVVARAVALGMIQPRLD